MSCANYCTLKRFTPTNIFQSFRNVMKLKNRSFDPHSKHFNSISETDNKLSKDRNFCTALVTKQIMFTPWYFNYRHFSRWAKFTQNGFFDNQNSRKKQRHKSLQFTEKMKNKFHYTKLRAKRRVTKTIVEIKENILTVPNGLCVLRMLSTPVLGYLVLSELYTASFGLFIVAGFTDLIDGFIARNFPNQRTMIGSFLDPAADKLLVATLFVTLTFNGLIPVPLTSLIIFRDACLMGAGFYIRYVSLPPPKTLSRYFDMSFVTASLSPTAISKANTFLQLCLVGASLAAPVFNYVDHTCLHVLWYVTGTTTVLSAASYVYYKNSTYKLFVKDSKK